LAYFYALSALLNRVRVEKQWERAGGCLKGKFASGGLWPIQWYETGEYPSRKVVAGADQPRFRFAMRGLSAISARR